MNANAKAEIVSPGLVKLEVVKLRFANLFEAKAFNEGEPRFSASFLMSPDHAAIKAIGEATKRVAVAKWGPKADEQLKALKLADKLALHSGDLKPNYPGFPGNFYINASNKVRPTVVDRTGAPVIAFGGDFYDGANVIAFVDLWAQDNQYGKRVNATLLGVQFHSVGDGFGGGRVMPASAFEDLSVSDDADSLV